MTGRRFLLILLSPVLLGLAIFSLLLGFSFFSGDNPAVVLAQGYDTDIAANARLVYFFARCILLPFQLLFIALVAAAAIWVFRRRNRITGWIIGEKPMAPLVVIHDHDEPGRVVIRPERRRTLQQIISSLIAILAIVTALILSLGQFIARSDLGVIVAALTSSLAWGARLPILDLLGGLVSIFESNLSVGDRIRYRQLDKTIDGVVENVDLRFASVRAESGELITIPHGELRVFRNFSLGNQKGVYVTIPVAARDFSRATDVLRRLAPSSPELVPYLAEPWSLLSQEGQLKKTMDLSLFGRTTTGFEDDLQQALYQVAHEQLRNEGIEIGAEI